MKCMEMNKKIYKITAISLIIMSFLLYGIMPFNICLPFSACIIAGITGVMIVVSEIVFWIGSMMIGREVVLKIRKKFSIMRLVNHMRDRKKGK
ncbi:MAG TPA: transporter suffix domain-containing protein [Lachnospiraceae bacterium]|nr:transporter suffix domain-containing protein [Lachnospiraceae bacterium]